MTDIMQFAGRPTHRSSYQGGERQHQQQQQQQQSDTGNSLSPYQQPGGDVAHTSDGGGYLPGVSELEAFPPSRPWNTRTGLEPMLGGGYAERSIPDPADAPWTPVSEYGGWQSAANGSIASQRRLQTSSAPQYSSNYAYGSNYHYPSNSRDSFSSGRESGNYSSAQGNASYTNQSNAGRPYPLDAPSPFTPSPTDSNPPMSPPHQLPPPYPSSYGSYPMHHMPSHRGAPYLPLPNGHSTASHNTHQPHSPTYNHQHHQQPPTTQSQPQSQQQQQPQQPPRPPRPANAFMLYRRDHQRQIRLQNSRLTNNEVSTLVGEMWRHEKESIKDEYRQRAAQGRVLHYAMYPDYQYTVKTGKKKKGGANGVTKSKAAKRASVSGSSGVNGSSGGGGTTAPRVEALTVGALVSPDSGDAKMVSPDGQGF
ncbi:hypothetical protein HDV00_001853 [Rhizophlyctis rosea]|nr:hypothetical protein HDV00_001853 [Rhizophlyctis rosea]